MDVKHSKYNFLVQDEVGDILWFNAATGNTMSLSADEWYAVSELQSPDAPSLMLLEKALRDGFLVPREQNETEDVLKRQSEARSVSRHLGLTIALTGACNLGCAYCITRDARALGKMSEEILQRVLRWWETRLQGQASCSLEWLGGEPLLQPERFLSMAGSLVKITKDAGVSMSHHQVITNGMNLSPSLVAQLLEVDVSAIQITLDGPPEIHNASRPTAEGRDSFEQTMAGIRNAAPVIPTTIRVNLTHDNAHLQESLLNILNEAGLSEQVHIYPARVYGQPDSEGKIHKPLMTPSEFARASLDFQLEALAKGFRLASLPSPLQNGYCGAVRANSFVVAPDGLLYRCSVGIRDADQGSVGVLGSDKQSAAQKLNADFYDQRFAGDKDTCLACKFLPLCQGGCPELARLGGAQDNHCTPWRYELGVRLIIEQERRKIEGMPPQSFATANRGDSRYGAERSSYS